MQIPHMCTIQQAVKELRDAGCTVIGETALRRWIKEGAVPHVKSGKRVLINMDALEKFLTAGATISPPSTSVQGGIRPVPDKI